MDYPFQICPNCNKHLRIDIDGDTVDFSCKCGYYSTKNISIFIEQYANKKSNKNPNDKTFSDVLNVINEGYEHLSTYFKKVKNEYINDIINIINETESSYEESYKRNMNILTFFKILIDNYDGSVEMKNTIMKKKIYIYQVEEKRYVKDLIKYFNTYNIIEKINIEEVKTIPDLRGSSLLQLKDKRIASCSYDKTVRIYDPSNDYHCDQELKRHSKHIISICQLEDGTIVSCSKDKSIIIGDYTIKKAHDDSIYKVITLPNNRIASSSKDTTIKIWKSAPPYSDTPIKVLKGHDESVMSLLYIMEKDMMISGCNDDTLRLWNMSLYQCETVIYRVKCESNNSLYQIDKDRVIVGGSDKFYIVNISKCIIEKKIKDDFGYVKCFLKLRDNKTIICGCHEGLFCFYDINTNEYKKIRLNQSDIEALLMIDDSTFLSSSFGDGIKVWNY